MAKRQGSAQRIISFAAIIRLWPRYGDLADDLGVEYQTVANWVRRSSIPHWYWEPIERSARKRDIAGITYDYLRIVEARERERSPNGYQRRRGIP